MTLSKQTIFPPPYESNNMKDKQNWNGTEFVRPEETIAIHRGGTVLKFKLGTKDILQQNVLDGNSIDTEEFGLGSSKSIYDFHDESDDRDEDCLKFTIDENPPPRPPPKKTKKQTGIKMRLPVTKAKKSDKNDVRQNGIESLIQASALRWEFVCFYVCKQQFVKYSVYFQSLFTIFSNNSGRRSPSTQEAIAGMLSIGQTYVPTGKGQKNPRKYSSSPLLEEENIKNVHQDEDYGIFS